MHKIILIVLFILFSNISYAEYIVCFDESNNFSKKVQGDCLRLGICTGFNNTGLNPNCIIATDSEYSKASKFTELDNNAVSGDRVVDMQQSEIDAIIASEQAAEDSAKSALYSIKDNDLDNIDLSNINLIKVDAKIDSINNLNQLKEFLKRLIRYIVHTSSDSI